MLPISSIREIKLLHQYYERVEAILRWPEAELYRVHDEMSLWSPGQHIYHITLVNKMIFSRIEQLYADESKEIVRKGGMNMQGHMVFLMGKIPRGKAKAPEMVEPPADVEKRHVRALVAENLKTLDKLADRGPYLHKVKGRFPHFALGNLNALQWLKLARIHTLHHIEIAGELRQSGT